MTPPGNPFPPGFDSEPFRRLMANLQASRKTFESMTSKMLAANLTFSRQLPVHTAALRNTMATWKRIEDAQRSLVAGFQPPAMKAFLARLREDQRLSLQFPLAMTDVGWPPPPFAPMALVREAVALHAKSGQQAEKAIEQLVVDCYDAEAVEDIRQSWTERLPCRRRLHIVDEAIHAHLRGHYYCSIPVLLAQCEGLIADGTGHVGQMGGPAYKKHIENLFAAGTTIGLQDAIDRAVYDFFSTVVVAKFEHGKPVASSLSRHAIMHGGDIFYGTPAGSLKSVLLFDYFQSPFKFASIPGGHVYHTDACPRLVTSMGRLVFYRSQTDATADGKRACSVCHPDR